MSFMPVIRVRAQYRQDCHAGRSAGRQGRQAGHRQAGTVSGMQGGVGNAARVPFTSHQPESPKYAGILPTYKFEGRFWKV